MSNQERFDCRRDRVGTLEEAVVTGAGDHDELALRDRIRDGGRRRKRHGSCSAWTTSAGQEMLLSLMGKACSPKSAKSPTTFPARLAEPPIYSRCARIVRSPGDPRAEGAIAR